MKKEETGFDRFDHFVLNQIEQLPICAENIARETRRDPHLGRIVQQIETGQDLTRLGYKTPEVNYRLGMFRIVKMKGMARSFVFWPGIDTEIEKIAKTCVHCVRNAHEPPKIRSHHWEYPKGLWKRVHLDYAGTVAGKILLIVVDAYSKWLEVKITSSTTTPATTAILEELFAVYGSPVTIVTDNEPQFTATEFESLLQKNGVKYH
ncbi:uncharacterized protein K02A2.6-like [Odontomachus brunneus]|uniref:uncharacterized protein K02A2.6-like n=1 Tax=Odontomachus brunneus TaxID=486640 RepID=UPI0013F1D2F2|nr:uncharacterized protein K02A2.6-like [Odontomachus brunneus]